VCGYYSAETSGADLGGDNTGLHEPSGSAALVEPPAVRAPTFVGLVGFSGDASFLASASPSPSALACTSTSRMSKRAKIGIACSFARSAHLAREGTLSTPGMEALSTRIEYGSDPSALNPEPNPVAADGVSQHTLYGAEEARRVGREG
jgi:hypothetical protein